MKRLLIIILFPFILFAKTYVLSGGNDSVAQIIASKILKKAYSRAHLKLKVDFVSLEASLKRSNAGEVDGEIARIKKISKIYSNLLRVPVDLVSVEAVAFSKNSTIHITQWNDLKDYRFTIVKGTKFIEHATLGMHRKMVSGFSKAFRNLYNGKTEIIVIPKLAGLKIQHDRQYNKIQAISPVLERLKLYHFVHKKNAYLIPILTPILQKMKENGEMKYIRQNYLKSITY